MKRIAGCMVGLAASLAFAAFAAAQLPVDTPVARPGGLEPPTYAGAGFGRPSAGSKPSVTQPQAAQTRSPLAIHTDLSQTAMWVGDRVVYTVEIGCPPGADILSDDLGRDRLRLDGLELLDATVEREAHADGSVLHRARYWLASYATGTETVRIHPLPVRYYLRRAGDRAEHLRTAQEVEIPGLDVPLRSTLPAAAPSGIRDARPLRTVPAFIGLLRPVGIGAILVSLAPVAVGIGAALARMRRPRPSAKSRRRHRREHREALDEIRQLAASGDPAARQEAYDRLGLVLREHLAGLGVPAQAMTAGELEPRVTGRSAAAIAIVSLLRDCDRVRYGDPIEVPGPEALEAALDQARELMEGRGRS